MKLSFVLSILFSFLILLLKNSYAAPRGFKVVLDPGHGGIDHGTVFRTKTGEVSEKEITLLLARDVAKKIRAKGIQAVLTRDSDRDLPLKERTAIANKTNADAFISIHMNSSAEKEKSKSEGIETYILNNTTDGSSKRLAHFENSVLNSPQAQAQAQENLDVALILKDLQLDANLGESKRLACNIQNALVVATEKLKVPGFSKRASEARNRGVRQALFFVLLGADMPSALVEVGFLNNARDRNIAFSPAGRDALATAIAQAIERFRKGVVLSRCKVH